MIFENILHANLAARLAAEAQEARAVAAKDEAERQFNANGAGNLVRKADGSYSLPEILPR